MLEKIALFMERGEEILAKLRDVIDLTQEEIDLCHSFSRETHLILPFISNGLYRNIYGRKYRRVVSSSDPSGQSDEYVRDDDGDYIGERGMFGQVWYTHKDYVLPKPTGEKFIGPFGDFLPDTEDK